MRLLNNFCLGVIGAMAFGLLLASQPASQPASQLPTACPSINSDDNSSISHNTEGYFVYGGFQSRIPYPQSVKLTQQAGAIAHIHFSGRVDSLVCMYLSSDGSVGLEISRQAYEQAGYPQLILPDSWKRIADSYKCYFNCKWSWLHR